MDKEALKLATGWNLLKMKNWYLIKWYDALDCLESFVKLLLILLQVILSPILMFFYIIGIKSVYEQINGYDHDERQRVKKYLDKNN